MECYTDNQMEIFIRRAMGSDFSELKELYQNTILTVNRKDYIVEEVEDRASCGNDTAHWVKGQH